MSAVRGAVSTFSSVDRFAAFSGRVNCTGEWRWTAMKRLSLQAAKPTFDRTFWPTLT
jgi:6-phosphogluconate dehydrogenase (decarboxylating)